MSTKLIAIASAVMFSGLGAGLAHAACTQDDIKLKYTEIGKLIQAEQAGDPNAADEMMAKMHMAQDEFTSGQMNSDEFCRAYDALIQEMKTKG
jgi:hypothetical protein